MQTVRAAAILEEACAALETVARRTADLLRSLASTEIPIPGSGWMVGDAAAHLVHHAVVCCEIAKGRPSPVESPAGAGCQGRSVCSGVRYWEATACTNVRHLAQPPERDPATLAHLLLETSARLVDSTAGRSDDQEVTFHCGLSFSLEGLICTCLGEHIIHGYDIATAIGAPWPIDASHAVLALSGIPTSFALEVDPETTRGLTVAYEIELRGVGRSVVRFVDGEFRVQLDYSGPVDCTISADPVAYLLVTTGRLGHWSATALGLISASGARPELAPRFPDLFICP